MHSHAIGHSPTQTKSHIDPCRDNRVTGVMVRKTDRRTDAILALYCRIFNSYNMDKSGLHDVYILIPRACSPWDSGIDIRLMSA